MAPDPRATTGSCTFNKWDLENGGNERTPLTPAHPASHMAIVFVPRNLGTWLGPRLAAFVAAAYHAATDPPSGDAQGPSPSRKFFLVMATLSATLFVVGHLSSGPSPHIRATDPKVHPLHGCTSVAMVARPDVEIVVCPGFGNDELDYIAPLGQSEGLVGSLQRRGFSTRVVPVKRRDWINVARGLADWKFIRGRGEPEGGAFRWYIEKLWETVNDVRKEDAAKQIVLVGHSAGGWLARAALGDNSWDGSGVTARQTVSALVTLGSPHLPPPPERADQTQGVLRSVDARFPGAHVQGIKYMSVASDVIVGSRDAPRGSAERIAYNSYSMLTGGDGDTAGDGVVALAVSHLDGADQLTLDGCVHSINKAGTLEASDLWYGSECVIDEWLAPLVESIGLDPAASATPQTLVRDVIVRAQTPPKSFLFWEPGRAAKR